MISPGLALALDVTTVDVAKMDGNAAGGEGLSPFEVICNLVIACVGCAICIFPKKMDDAGYLPAIPLLVLGCFCCRECGVLIADGCEMAERLKADGSQVSDYEAFALVSAGPSWKVFLAISKNGAMLGFIVVFMQFVTDSFASYLPADFRKEHPNAKPLIRFCVTLPLHLAMTQIKDLTALAKFNNLGVASVVTEVVALIVGALLHYANAESCDGRDSYDRWKAKQGSLVADLQQKNPCIWHEGMPDPGSEIDAMGSYMASAVFAFAVLSTIPNLRSQMTYASKAPSALTTGLIIVMVTYIVVMAVGYLGYGEGAPANFAEALANDFPAVGLIASTAILINSLISAPIFIICVIEAFENMGSSTLHTAYSLPNQGFRAALVVGLCFTGFVFTDIGSVISLISAVFCVCNNIFLPIFFFHSLRKKVSAAGLSLEPFPAWKKAFHAFIIIVGMFTMVFGVKGALATLMAVPSEEDVEKTAVKAANASAPVVKAAATAIEPAAKDAVKTIVRLLTPA